MTATALTPIDLDDEEFTLASYQQHEKHIPAMDGYRAAKLNLRFAGGGSLDRTSLDDLKLLTAARSSRRQCPRALAAAMSGVGLFTPPT
jgi:hypothetical protein